MPAEYVPIEKLDVTVMFEKLADWIWDAVHNWSRLDQNSLGEQLLRSADSVAANIVEGGNREGDPDALRFFVFARGSAAEAAYWLRRALKRQLLDAKQGERVFKECEIAQHMLGSLISYRRSTKWKVREGKVKYKTTTALEPKPSKTRKR